MIRCFEYIENEIYIAYDITGIYLTIKNDYNDEFKSYLMKGNGVGAVSPRGTRDAFFYLQYEHNLYERLIKLQSKKIFKISIENNLILIKIRLNQDRLNEFMECISVNYQDLRRDFGADPV